jgi:hypothetical protein
MMRRDSKPRELRQERLACTRESGEMRQDNRGCVDKNVSVPTRGGFHLL